MARIKLLYYVMSSANKHQICRNCQMDGFDNILTNIAEKGIFSHKDLFILFSDRGSTVSKSTLDRRLRAAIRSGLVVRVGRNQYMLTRNGRTRYVAQPSESCREIVDYIQSKCPDTRISVFETRQMNEFVNHLVAINTIFVYVGNGMSDFLFQVLHKRFSGRVLLKPTEEEYFRYRVENMVVLLDGLSEEPRNMESNGMAPVEKWLVDLFEEPLIRQNFNGADLPGACAEIFARYAIDESKLFRYARRRNAEGRLKILLTEHAGVNLLTR